MVTFIIPLIIVGLMKLDSCCSEAPPLDILCASQELCNSHVEPLKSFNILDKPCCLACSCEPDCVNIGDCCPDSGFVQSPSRPRECHLPVSRYDEEILMLDNAKLFGGIQRYSAVATCPEGEPDKGLIFKCEQKEPEFPDDIVMVVDSYGHLFKNAFCAQCNDVTSFSLWQLRVRCSDVGTSLMYTPSMPFSHFNECTFWSEPQEPRLYEGSRCFVSYDTCNMTGLWDVYDPHIDEKCNNIQMYYLNSVYRNRFRVYKNIYCYMCNVDSTSRPDVFCQPDIPYLTFGGRYKFIAILKSLQPLTEPVQKDRRLHPCDPSDVFDPIFEKCRELICHSVFAVPLYGQCEENFQVIFGVSIKVTFTIQVISLNQRVIQHMYDQRQSIYTQVERHIGIPSRCVTCDKSLWTKLGNGSLHIGVQVTYKTSVDCDFFYLQSTFMNHPESIMTLFSDIGAVQAKVTTLPGDADLSSNGYEETNDIFFSICTGNVLNFKKTELCPRLAFSNDEYESLVSKEIFIPGTTDPDNNYLICAGEYLALTSAGQPLFEHFWPMMSVVFIFNII